MLKLTIKFNIYKHKCQVININFVTNIFIAIKLTSYYIMDIKINIKTNYF